MNRTCTRGAGLRPLVALSLALAAFSGCGPGPGVDASSSAVSGAPPSALPRTRHSVRADDGHQLTVWAKAPSEVAGVVLLVHGRTWSIVPDFDLQVPGEDLSLMDGLSALRLASYGVDLRGYGQTARDESGWNTPRRAARDVVAVLEWLRTRHPDTPLYLFGWSLGSMVSQLATQLRPDLVERLVLFGYPHDPVSERPVEMPSGPPPMSATTPEAAASDFITPGSISQRAIDTYVGAALEADPVRTDWTAGHEWNELDPAAVSVPTLILQGEHDPLSPSPALAALYEGLGSADKSWIVIPGGDHAAFLETPRPYFLAALDAFLLRGLP